MGNPWKVAVITYLVLSLLPIDYAMGWRRISGETPRGVVDAHVCLPGWPCDFGLLAGFIRRWPDFHSDFSRSTSEE